MCLCALARAIKIHPCMMCVRACVRADVRVRACARAFVLTRVNACLCARASSENNCKELAFRKAGFY